MTTHWRDEDGGINYTDSYTQQPMPTYRPYGDNTSDNHDDYGPFPYYADIKHREGTLLPLFKEMRHRAEQMDLPITEGAGITLDISFPDGDRVGSLTATSGDITWYIPIVQVPMGMFQPDIVLDLYSNKTKTSLLAENIEYCVPIEIEPKKPITQARRLMYYSEAAIHRWRTTVSLKICHECKHVHSIGDDCRQLPVAPKTRVAIVGSRKYPQLERVRQAVRHLAKSPEKYVIVSGGAPGVDSVAEEEADATGIEKKIFSAQWYVDGKFDRAAGFKRNKDIISNADYVLCFWDGVSGGTRDDIELCQQMGKKYRVFLPSAPASPKEKNQ